MTPFSPVGSLTCLRTGLGSIIYIFGSLSSIWSAPYGVCDLTNQVSGHWSCEPHPPFWEQWTSLNMALSRIHRSFQACRSGLGALASTGGLLRENRPSHVPARTLFGRDRDRPKASHSRVLTGTEGQLRNLFEIQGEIFSLRYPSAFFVVDLLSVVKRPVLVLQCIKWSLSAWRSTCNRQGNNWCRSRRTLRFPWNCLEAG